MERSRQRTWLFAGRNQTRSPARSAISERGKTRAEWRREGHCLGVGPALADLRVQPLAENGVAKAEQNCGQRHAVPKKLPTPNPGGQSGERQREHGYQEIAGRAVDDGEEDLEPRAGRPDRI